MKIRKVNKERISSIVLAVNACIVKQEACRQLDFQINYCYLATILTMNKKLQVLSRLTLHAGPIRIILV